MHGVASCLLEWRGAPFMWVSGWMDGCMGRVQAACVCTVSQTDRQTDRQTEMACRILSSLKRPEWGPCFALFDGHRKVHIAPARKVDECWQICDAHTSLTCMGRGRERERERWFRQRDSLARCSSVRVRVCVCVCGELGIARLT